MPAQRIVGLFLALALNGAAIAYAAPAAADDSFAVLASARVSFVPIAGGWRVCGDGSFPTSSVTAGRWAFLVIGSRGGVPFSVGPEASEGNVAHFCEDVLRDSATGFVAANLSYTAAGSYVLAESMHGYTWEPNTGIRPFGVDPNP